MTKKKKEKAEKNELTYKDIEDIVEYLVRTKARNYKFDCFEEDDIAQEIRIICLRALKHFDITRVKEDKWKNFFGRCVDNGLKNLKRDNYLRTAPPCKGDCGFLHGDQYLDNTLGSVCKRWLKFRQNLRRKIKVLHPIPIEVIGDTIKDGDQEKEVQAKDLERFVIESISEDLREGLVKMINGKGKSIPRREKKRIQAFVKRILE